MVALLEIVPDASLLIKQSRRRRRYERTPSIMATVALTPTKVKLLWFLAGCRFLSLPQLARLCCPGPRLDLSCKSARRHMRELFDAGLVDVLPVSRLALASLDAPNDQTLLYGSAPNLYVPTQRGLILLHQAGLVDREVLKRPPPSYGPKNSLFLAHELQVRDVRVWLEGCARHYGAEHQVLQWRAGAEAVIAVRRNQEMLEFRPDAWFVYRLSSEPKRVLVGLVEVDRGTERGDRHWGEKLEAYQRLFAHDNLQQATGYTNARVLVFCPDRLRRDILALFIGARGGTEAKRFWLADQEAFQQQDLAIPFWRQPHDLGLHKLLPTL